MVQNGPEAKNCEYFDTCVATLRTVDTTVAPFVCPLPPKPVYPYPGKKPYPPTPMPKPYY
jgi:hypothetical protein